MPTQTELEFYKTFGIESNEAKFCNYECKRPFIAKVTCIGSEDCKYYNLNLGFPEITDRQLLELVRLGFNQGFVIYSKNLEDFKERLLKLLIFNKTDEIYHTVQKIMEVENDR